MWNIVIGLALLIVALYCTLEKRGTENICTLARVGGALILCGYVQMLLSRSQS